MYETTSSQGLLLPTGSNKRFSVNLTTQSELLATMRAVSRHYYGPLGTFAYDAYDHVNRSYYGGDLPVPMIQIGVTGYGACLGNTRTNDNAQPIIRLHPSTIVPATARKNEKIRPSLFGYPRSALGLMFAYEVLLHELVHVAVDYLVGRGRGDSSHNCEGWCSEVNRISPQIGISDATAMLTTVKRIPVEGSFTKTGKPETKTAKVTGGNLNLGTISRWPHAMREDEYYTKEDPPFVLSDSIEEIEHAARCANG